MSAPLPRHPRRTSFRRERRDGGVVLLREPRGEPILLNPTAFALWELCDGGTAVDEMVGAVSELFSLDDERARHDVEAALREMWEAGVIR